MLVTESAKKLELGKFFSLKGPLMQKALTVTRTAACDFTFDYGDRSDGNRWFRFDMNSKGHGAYSNAKPLTTDSHLYCSKVGSAGSGMTIECSFPAW